MTPREIADKALEKRPFLFLNDNGLGYRKDGTPFRYGLQPGSGDMIGWTEIIISPEMVGKRIAVFTSIEIKTKNDRMSDKQKKWFLAVKRSGGIAKIHKERNDETIEIQENI